MFAYVSEERAASLFRVRVKGKIYETIWPYIPDNHSYLA
jgi:hypothetical protein